MDEIGNVRLARALLDFLRDLGCSGEQIAGIADLLKQHLLVEGNYREGQGDQGPSLTGQLPLQVRRN